MNLLLLVSPLLLAALGGHAFTPSSCSRCRSLLLDTAAASGRPQHARFQPTFMNSDGSDGGKDDFEKAYFLGKDEEDPSKSATPSSASSAATSKFDLPSPPSLEEVGALIKKSAKFDFVNVDTDIIKANLLDGEVGQRGEAWTAATLLLILCIAIGAIPIAFLDKAANFLGGPGLMLGGGAILTASLSDLGIDNLTPFLSPTTGGSLVTEGIYSRIRHPIYAGLIALCAGFSILTGSAPRLVITALLIFVLDIKSDKEEEMLSAKYPEYSAYKATVPGKFLPTDWSFRRSDD